MPALIPPSSCCTARLRHGQPSRIPQKMPLLTSRTGHARGRSVLFFAGRLERAIPRWSRRMVSADVENMLLAGIVDALQLIAVISKLLESRRFYLNQPTSKPP